MILDPGETPPKGTVRDWLDARARGRRHRLHSSPKPARPLTWPDLQAAACGTDRRRPQPPRASPRARASPMVHPNGHRRCDRKALYAALYGGFRVDDDQPCRRALTPSPTPWIIHEARVALRP